MQVYSCWRDALQPGGLVGYVEAVLLIFVTLVLVLAGAMAPYWNHIS